MSLRSYNLGGGGVECTVACDRKRQPKNWGQPFRNLVLKNGYRIMIVSERLHFKTVNKNEREVPLETTQI